MADNASNNNTMAQELSLKIATFDASQHLLGCTGHVLNLAAQGGLVAIGHNIEDNITDVESEEDADLDLIKIVREVKISKKSLWKVNL